MKLFLVPLHVASRAELLKWKMFSHSLAPEMLLQILTICGFVFPPHLLHFNVTVQTLHCSKEKGCNLQMEVKVQILTAQKGMRC